MREPMPIVSSKCSIVSSSQKKIPLLLLLCISHGFLLSLNYLSSARPKPCSENQEKKFANQCKSYETRSKLIIFRELKLQIFHFFKFSYSIIIYISASEISSLEEKSEISGFIMNELKVIRYSKLTCHKLN